MRVELAEAIERYGPDAFRYFMLREIPFDGDGAFSWERFDERYTADLANAFGNLRAALIAMVERYCRGASSQLAGRTRSMTRTQAITRATPRPWTVAAGTCFRRRCACVWLTVARGNEYVDRQAPWKLAKDPAQRPALDAVLATLVRQLVRQAVHLAPSCRSAPRRCGGSSALPGRSTPSGSAPQLAALDPTGWQRGPGRPFVPQGKT